MKIFVLLAILFVNAGNNILGAAAATADKDTVQENIADALLTLRSCPTSNQIMQAGFEGGNGVNVKSASDFGIKVAEQARKCEVFIILLEARYRAILANKPNSKHCALLHRLIKDSDDKTSLNLWAQ